jgi:hypothetical protein
MELLIIISAIKAAFDPPAPLSDEITGSDRQTLGSLNGREMLIARLFQAFAAI